MTSNDRPHLDAAVRRLLSNHAQPGTGIQVSTGPQTATISLTLATLPIEVLLMPRRHGLWRFPSQDYREAYQDVLAALDTDNRRSQ